ncbi:period circadian protein homolog 1-like [Leptopilina heterotoma]|uniref:period circadian protein homolog 1-like n=1 Tax=Leptopilina heterotoma TaxID=63436 RepID=UPI001CA88AD9|nr:period circadian protein homolog 1-like [Leptopilina heterotoma]
MGKKRSLRRVAQDWAERGLQFDECPSAPIEEVQLQVGDEWLYRQYCLRRNRPAPWDAPPLPLPLPRFGIATVNVTVRRGEPEAVYAPIAAAAAPAPVVEVPEVREPARLPRPEVSNFASRENWYYFDYVSSNRPKPRAVVRPTISQPPPPSLVPTKESAVAPEDVKIHEGEGSFSPIVDSPPRSPPTPEVRLQEKSPPEAELVIEEDVLNLETSPLSGGPYSPEGTPEATRLRPTFSKLPLAKRRKIVCDLLTLF